MVTVTRAPARTIATYVATVGAWGVTTLGGAAALTLTAPACARSLDWWGVPASLDALLTIVMIACVGVLVAAALVEVGRRASRNSWWCVPLLLILTIGLGAATWFLPLSWLNGYLEDELVPACQTATPRLFIDFIEFGLWVTLFSPVLLIVIWAIGRLRRIRTTAREESNTGGL